MKNDTSDEDAKAGALQALQVLLEPIDNANGETLCFTHDSNRNCLSSLTKHRIMTGISTDKQHMNVQALEGSESLL